jgi:hypothetical protein
MDELPSPEEIASTFEAVEGDGLIDGPIYRGTHRHASAVVERTYRLEDGALTVETAYHDDETTVDVVDECWLLDEDGHVRHTGQEIEPFCRDHHFEEPELDVAFCFDHPEDDAETVLPGDVVSTFQPAQRVRIDERGALRYTGEHQSGSARVQRRYYVDERTDVLTIETGYRWDDDRLGRIEEQQALIDDGTFVAQTGEPIDAFCRRTHLVAPERDVAFCLELAGETDRDATVTDGPSRDSDAAD